MFHTQHGLSYQSLGVFLDAQTLKKHPSAHPQICVRNFLKCQSQAYNWFFHLHIILIPLYKDIMPCFDEFVNVYGWNLSILWSPLKIWTSENFRIGNFGHPVSKSWLRPWYTTCCIEGQMNEYHIAFNALNYWSWINHSIYKHNADLYLIHDVPPPLLSVMMEAALGSQGSTFPGVDFAVGP